MVNVPEKNPLPLPAGKYGESTKRSTRWRHHANQGKSSLDAERVRALGALRNLLSTKKLEEGKRWDTHLLSNKEKEK